MTSEILDFYKTSGERTAIDCAVAEKFPDDVAGIVSLAQNILIHVVRIRREKIKNLENAALPKTVVDIFENFDQDFLREIPIEKKQIGICRNFSMLVAAVLRSKGIAARCRCGFAIYFGGGNFEDHWICEYWNESENRWTQVDAQMDEYWTDVLHLDSEFFNPLDLKKGEFFPAGEIWKLYRAEKIDGNICGFSLDKKFGAYYIRANLLRDLAAINKFEKTYEEVSDLMRQSHALSKIDVRLLDTVADLLSKLELNFKVLRKIYEPF